LAQTVEDLSRFHCATSMACLEMGIGSDVTCPSRPEAPYLGGSGDRLVGWLLSFMSQYRNVRSIRREKAIVVPMP
jgi:hypothetical protein